MLQEGGALGYAPLLILPAPFASENYGKVGRDNHRVALPAPAQQARCIAGQGIIAHFEQDARRIQPVLVYSIRANPISEVSVGNTFMSASMILTALASPTSSPAKR